MTIDLMDALAAKTHDDAHEHCFGLPPRTFEENIMWQLHDASCDQRQTSTSGERRSPSSSAGRPRKVTPYLANGWPRACWGCGNPFVIRDGHAQAIVGPDGRLYCYGTGCEDEVFAPEVMALKRAS